RLNLELIEKSLRRVQREFPRINEILHSRRDSLSDEVLENMMTGYALVDKVITEDINLLTAKHAPYLLELNHVVLCGHDRKFAKNMGNISTLRLSAFTSRKDLISRISCDGMKIINVSRAGSGLRASMSVS